MSKPLSSDPDLYFLTTAAELIGGQVGLDHVQRERLVKDMREAVGKGELGAYFYMDCVPLRKNAIGELVRKIGVDEFGDDEHCTVEPTTPLCVRPAGVNAWLKTTGCGFTWDVQAPASVELFSKPANPSAASTRHTQKNKRRDTITPVIEHAQSLCKNKWDPAEVWGQLHTLTAERFSVLLHLGDGAIVYTDGDSTKQLTRKKLATDLEQPKEGGALRLKAV